MTTERKINDWRTRPGTFAGDLEFMRDKQFLDFDPYMQAMNYKAHLGDRPLNADLTTPQILFDEAILRKASPKVVLFLRDMLRLKNIMDNTKTNVTVRPYACTPARLLSRKTKVPEKLNPRYNEVWIPVPKNIHKTAEGRAANQTNFATRLDHRYMPKGHPCAVMSYDDWLVLGVAQFFYGRTDREGADSCDRFTTTVSVAGEVNEIPVSIGDAPNDPKRKMICVNSYYAHRLGQRDVMLEALANNQPFTAELYPHYDEALAAMVSVSAFNCATACTAWLDYIRSDGDAAEALLNSEGRQGYEL